MAAPSILLAGDFDATDPGHDAVIQACADALPGFALTVASSDPLTTSARHGVRRSTVPTAPRSRGSRRAPTPS